MAEGPAALVFVVGLHIHEHVWVCCVSSHYISAFQLKVRHGLQILQCMQKPVPKVAVQAVLCTYCSTLVETCMDGC